MLNVAVHKVTINIEALKFLSWKAYGYIYPMTDRRGILLVEAVSI
jgi:hypothetical protein